MRLFSLLFFIVHFYAQAANWYVNSSASGAANGTDWNNAWSDVTAINWGSISAGDSIWIAGGTYGTMAIAKSGSPGSAIYVARVRTTNSAPATAAGWNPSYDSTVLIRNVTAAGYSYWTIDGQVPNGGLIISNATPNSRCVDMSTASCGNMTLRNLLMSGVCTNQTMSFAGDFRCVNLNFASTTPGTNLTIQYCTLQQADTLISTLNMSGILVEHCKLQKTFAGNSGNHPNVYQVTGGTNCTFRFNEVVDYLTEGIMMDFTSSGDAPNDGWDIYGNVWHDPYPGWSSRIIESQYRAQYHIRVYNNTFVALGNGILVGNGGSWGTGCVSTNNIFFSSGSGYGFALGTDDYNLSDGGTTPGAHSINSATSGIFASYAGQNYHIVSNIAAAYPRNKGATLSSTYNTDIDGNTRGADGAWDIGAYEYVSPPSGQGSSYFIGSGTLQHGPGTMTHSQ